MGSKKWTDALLEGQSGIHRLARAKGWWDPQLGVDPMCSEAIGAKLLMVVSEISEATEELRGWRIATWYSGVGRAGAPNGKPEGFGIELADAVIRILDLAEAMGLDLGALIEEKMLYNATRSQRHGDKAL